MLCRGVPLSMTPVLWHIFVLPWKQEEPLSSAVSFVSDAAIQVLKL